MDTEHEDDEPAGDRLTFLDTFDWRVYRAGWTLMARAGDGKTTLDLVSRDGTVIGQEVLAGLPGFTSDLAEGGIREHLEPILEMRRLAPVVTLSDQDRRLRIVDDLEKTVVRVALRTGEASSGDVTGAGNSTVVGDDSHAARHFRHETYRVRAILDSKRHLLY